MKLNCRCWRTIQLRCNSVEALGFSRREPSLLFPNSDIDFPTATAYTFRATTQAMLLQRNVLTKPGIWDHFGNGTSHLRFLITITGHLLVQISMFARSEDGSRTIHKKLD